ncbi:MAG: hypothetical protein M1830_002779, partial [Pleopsidium flavum]
MTTAELDFNKGDRERVIILGSGWAGYVLSRKLNPKRFQILVVSPRSYFVFTPLLNSTAVGTLEFRTALEPVRDRRSHVQFFQAWADDVDFANKTVTVEESVVNPLVTKAIVGNTDRNVSKGEAETASRLKKNRQEGKMFDLKYDKLVVAVGCYSQTFGTKGVKKHALFMKDIGDARKVRKRVLECFEIAELPITTDTMRKNLLHFAIVGGGPTGMEFAAELSDLIHEDLLKLYPELRKFIKISVYDVAPKVLSMFDESLGRYAMEVFKREGVEIKTSHHVEELRPGLPAEDIGILDVRDTEGCYTLKTKEEGEVGVAMCVWSTGNMMNPFVQNAVKKCHTYPEASAMTTGENILEKPNRLEWMIKKNEKTGAIVVDDHLRIQLETQHGENQQPEAKAVMKDVFALGDNAALENIILPATAQTANQQALWLGKHLNKGDIDTQTFSFKDMGMMTYLGNAKGLVQTPGDRMSGIQGRTAWLIWRGAYLTLSVSWRNKILIPIY